MKKNEIQIFVNRILHLFEVMRVKTESKIVYLTFDDGPEDGITEFVVSLLREYGFKATFFCKGENVEKNNKQYSLLIDEGHAIGNHTYSHINGFENSTKGYYDDIEKADKLIHSHLFRPPWGSITLNQYLLLRKKYKVIYWSLNSADCELENFDLEKSLDNLKTNTTPGDVVLFHCCKRHEKETRQLLPIYIKWLFDNGYKSDILK